MVVSGRVADNNNNFDQSLSRVNFTLWSDWYDEIISLGNTPLDGNGMFERLIDTISLSDGVPFPLLDSLTFYARANEEDPGMSTTFTLEEGRTLEVSHIDVIGSLPGIMTDIRAQIEILGAPLGAPRYCFEGEVQINWSTTFGELSDTTTYLDESCQTWTSISAEEGSSGTVTAQVVGWGDHQHSITIDVDAGEPDDPKEIIDDPTAFITNLVATPNPAYGNAGEYATITVRGRVINEDNIPLTGIVELSHMYNDNKEFAVANANGEFVHVLSVPFIRSEIVNIFAELPAIANSWKRVGVSFIVDGGVPAQ